MEEKRAQRITIKKSWLLWCGCLERGGEGAEDDITELAVQPHPVHQREGLRKHVLQQDCKL